MRMNGLLCYCRAGFEPELAAELTERAAQTGHAGYARTERGSGFVVFADDDATTLSHALPWRELIFARQKLQLIAELRDLDPRDRIGPMLSALLPTPVGGASAPTSPPEARSGTPRFAEPRFGEPRFGELVVEHPDSDAAKPLSGLARSFGNALRPALRKAGLLSTTENTDLPRLHVCFVAGDHALLAIGDPRDSARWPLGIPRLRMHAEAPSRSALKLEEALLCLLNDDERQRLLQPGMRAADLGAAPGGWTWVLMRHGLQVTAIDNGPLRPHLLDSGLVEHLRADGFAWQPQRAMDWMVCDMVEQPRRVATRMAQWFREGWCRHAIFNLKLPMKKRWQETTLCLQEFSAQAAQPLLIRARQLYHDREEITVFASSPNRN